VKITGFKVCFLKFNLYRYNLEGTPGFFHADLDEPFGLGDAAAAYPREVRLYTP
jgi:hypothetical protein